MQRQVGNSEDFPSPLQTSCSHDQIDSMFREIDRTLAEKRGETNSDNRSRSRSRERELIPTAGKSERCRLSRMLSHLYCWGRPLERYCVLFSQEVKERMMIL